MLDYTYFFSVKDMVIQFMDAMNGVICKRYDADRNVLSQYPATLIYSPKQRVLYDIVNKSKQIVLPVISFSIGGIQRDPERVFNKLDGSYYDTDRYGADVAEHLRQPLPIDVTINMSIITRYQADIDQIIDNFIPYFDPYIVIQWHVPNFGHLLNSPVIWSGAINLTYPTDIDPSVNYHVTADTSFIIKGWTFKSQKTGTGKIYTIYSTYTSLSSIPTRYQDLIHDPLLVPSEHFEIHAEPRVLLVAPTLAIETSGQKYELYGDMFYGTFNVYLTGSTASIFPSGSLTAMDIFTHNQSLSSKFPAFSGVPVSSFEVINNSKIEFILPEPMNAGYEDIIVVNHSGYSNLRKDAFRPTSNPYLSGMPEYESYIEPQPESLSGLRIV